MSFRQIVLAPPATKRMTRPGTVRARVVQHSPDRKLLRIVIANDVVDASSLAGATDVKLEWGEGEDFGAVRIVPSEREWYRTVRLAPASRSAKVVATSALPVGEHALTDADGRRAQFVLETRPLQEIEWQVDDDGHLVVFLPEDWFEVVDVGGMAA